MLSALIPSRHSYPAVGWAPQLAHQRSSHLGPLVLEMTALNLPAPTPDRDRTVPRRSEPSSRAAFMGEHPNPWVVLPPQDATSRQPGGKPCRRCELSRQTRLLAPPRGLFVLSWVTRIFTGTSISPSPLSRQCSSRYSLRAGRNLPDKEFRYLRTVIVTAAVHRGFPSWLRSPLRFTFRHWAGVSPYTSACALAETCVFGKQSLEPFSCDPLTPLSSRESSYEGPPSSKGTGSICRVP